MGVEIGSKDDRTGEITFHVRGIEIIRFSTKGDIYVHGKFVENDKEVVEGLREFLRNWKDDN